MESGLRKRGATSQPTEDKNEKFNQEACELVRAREAGSKIVETKMEMSGKHNFPGRLFIVEGIDGSGKSTQLSLLHRWLESEGHPVVFSEWNSSPLVKKVTRRGKKKRILTPMTFSLIHATDFSDRLEHEIIPALKAGFIVLTDRCVYTLVARALVRGIDPNWIRQVYGFALKPDRIFYLRAGVDDLVTRVLQEGGFDYWESGTDLHLGDDMYESFVEYQSRIAGQFDRMVEDYGFKVIDASRSIEEVFADLKSQVSDILDNANPVLAESISSSRQFHNGQ